VLLEGLRRPGKSPERLLLLDTVYQVQLWLCPLFAALQPTKRGYAMFEDMPKACCMSLAAKGCFYVTLIVTSPSKCDARSTALLCHPVLTLCIFRMF